MLKKNKNCFLKKKLLFEPKNFFSQKIFFVGKTLFFEKKISGKNFFNLWRVKDSTSKSLASKKFRYLISGD